MQPKRTIRGSSTNIPNCLTIKEALPVRANRYSRFHHEFQLSANPGTVITDMSPENSRKGTQSQPRSNLPIIGRYFAEVAKDGVVSDGRIRSYRRCPDGRYLRQHTAYDYGHLYNAG